MVVFGMRVCCLSYSSFSGHEGKEIINRDDKMFLFYAHNLLNQIIIRFKASNNFYSSPYHFH